MRQNDTKVDVLPTALGLKYENPAENANMNCKDPQCRTLPCILKDFCPWPTALCAIWWKCHTQSVQATKYILAWSLTRVLSQNTYKSKCALTKPFSTKKSKKHWWHHSLRWRSVLPGYGLCRISKTATTWPHQRQFSEKVATSSAKWGTFVGESKKHVDDRMM